MAGSFSYALGWLRRKGARWREPSWSTVAEAIPAKGPTGNTLSALILAWQSLSRSPLLNRPQSCLEPHVDSKSNLRLCTHFT